MWPGIRDNRPLVHLLLLHSASLVDRPRRASRAPPGVDGLRLFAALVAAPPSQLDGWQRIWHPLRPHNLGNLEGAQRARLPSGLTHGASVSHGHQTARRARVLIVYGQLYGRLPYGRFSDCTFFSFLEIFLSFSEKNKFRHFFMSQNNFSKWKIGR